jgi:hypothetical protein
MKPVKIPSLFLGLASLFLAGNAMAAVPQGKSLEQRDAAGAYIKPQAPVDVRFKVLGAALPGQPVDVEIVLSPNKAAQGLSADVRTGPEMIVSRRSRAEKVDDISRPMATRQVITLLPKVEGLHTMVVFAKVLADGQEQSRVVTFPIQVGNSTKPVRTLEPEMGELMPDGRGRMVRDVPAVATVKPADQD